MAFNSDYRWCVAYRCVQLLTLLDIQWVMHRTVQDQLDYRAVCAHWVPNKSHRLWQSSLYRAVWAFLVSIGHVTLIKESNFGAEMWLITQNLKPEKSNKENGSIVISKYDRGKLSWDQNHVLVLDFLDHGDTVECYCGTLSLRWPYFCKRPQLLRQSIVLLHANARRHTSNWT